MKKILVSPSQKAALLCCLLLSTHLCAQQAITITESKHADRPHYIIRTAAATYFYDRNGGGFSRILDQYGNDWISFQADTARYPAAAATSSRGLPNLVVEGSDNGIGHPGFEQCVSKQLDSLASIRSTSKDKKWQWRWDFFPTYAKLTIEKIDKNRAYWFLYAGTPGGRFNPKQQFWATNSTGLRFDQPDYYNKQLESGYWQWAYFGMKGVGRVFFIAQQSPDRAKDVFGYLGYSEQGIQSPDGMAIFAFGRNTNAEPLLQEPQVFYIGFLDKNIQSAADHNSLALQIQQFLLKAGKE